MALLLMTGMVEGDVSVLRNACFGLFVLLLIRLDSSALSDPAESGVLLAFGVTPGPRARWDERRRNPEIPRQCCHQGHRCRQTHNHPNQEHRRDNDDNNERKRQ